jgi:hypothetical protein
MIKSRFSIKTALVTFLIAGFFVSKTFAQTGQLSIQVHPTFAGKSLELGNTLYHSSNGDSLYVDVLRFYITDMTLHQKKLVKFKEPLSCHLIDAEEPGSQTINLQQVPVGRYDAISFNIGTDSSTNVSGAIGGDLDPTLGMYWAWNTGYINLKIEGRSNSCNTRNHTFEFHVGGYLPHFQTLRRVTLPLKNYHVNKNEQSSLNLQLELTHFFDQISLKNTNQVMIPSLIATQLANYFQSTWSVF